jgi:hypothetical protein
MDCPDVCLKALWLKEWQWVLKDCHKRFCWKNSIGVNVPVPCGSDVYVCSSSFRQCLTVVYWLLECNKVPSWIEQPEYATVRYGWVVNTPTSYSWGPWFKYRPRDRLNWLRFSVVSLSPSRELYLKWPLLYKSFRVHHLLTTIYFDII